MRFPRSGGPAGVRLRAALALSLALHGLALFPWQRLVRPAPPPPRPAPALSATLLAPILKTYEERTEPPSPPASVPPASTSGISRAAPPRQLKGRALDTALAAMAREEFYPRAAIARGLEGRVVLLLTLAEDGTVTEIEIAGSSGHGLLDDAARRAARRIGTLPGGRRQVLLPVEFRLE
jgi:protein TonB